MRVYALTPIGQSLAKQPTKEMTDGWKIVYFLRRHGGKATDEQIIQFAGIESMEAARSALRKLTAGKSPVVKSVA